MQKRDTNIVLIVTIALILLCVAAYFIGRGIGKNAPPPKKDLPDDNNPGYIGAPLTAAEQATVNSLASRIYDDISGISFSGHDNDLYQECLNLSDRLATALYNTYNSLYFKKYNETLTETLNNEIEPFGPRKIFAFAGRLESLGLN